MPSHRAPNPPQSSRAHTLFVLAMEKTRTDRNGTTSESNELFMVDLAGRENEKTTLATGERLVGEDHASYRGTSSTHCSRANFSRLLWRNAFYVKAVICGCTTTTITSERE